MSAENAARVVRSLEAFGFGGLGITEVDSREPNRVIQLGFPPYRIDILTSIEGVEFDEAGTRRVVLDLDGVRVPFIGREDLLTNKRAAGGPQDLADVARLTDEGNV